MKKIQVKIDGKWLGVEGFFVETNKKNVHSTRFPEDCEDVRIVCERIKPIFTERVKLDDGSIAVFNYP